MRISTCLCCPPSFTAPAVSRRSFLGGAAASAVAATVAAPMAFAQASPRRIDVHCHVASPSWMQAMDVIGRRDRPLSNWSVAKLIEDMDKGGVATAIMSPTTPQVTPLGLDTAVRVCRESNEYSKKMESDHPGRFGTFAMLPLPHIDESLKAIAYAFDQLKVDGVGIMTSYKDKWLGDPTFYPVWEELHRRKATVYTHPTGANCCVNLVAGIGESSIEFGTDTTRSIAQLIFSGASQRYKDINWIWSHGGGSLPSFAERFLIQVVSVPPYKGKFTREIVQGELDRYFYDTAQVANSGAIDAIAKLVPISQIVFGTDFPYRTAIDHAKGVEAHFKGDDLRKVDRDNALRLLPRLKNA
jgi:6-methylsalicylate decarboxylase